MKSRILLYSFYLVFVSAFGQTGTKQFILSVEKDPEKAMSTFSETGDQSIDPREKQLILDVYKNIRLKNEIGRIEALINLTDESATFDDYTKAWANYNLAATIIDFNLLPEAEHFTKKAIYYSNKLDDKDLMFLSYRNLAGLYFKLHEYKKSYCNFIACLNFKKSIDKHHIASTYNNLGLCLFKLKQYRKALSFYEKGLSIVKNSNESSSLEVYYLILGNRGTLFHKTGKIDQAFSDLKQELDYYTSKKITNSNYFGTLSELHEIDMRYYDDQSNYFDLFYSKFKSIKQFHDKHAAIKNFIDKNEALLSTDKKLLVYKEALNTSRIYDSITRQNHGNIMSLLYNDKLKNLNSSRSQMAQEIKRESKNNQVKSILILLCLISIFIMFIFLWKIQKQKATKLYQAKLIQIQQEEIHKANQKLLQNEITAKKEELNQLNLNLRIKKETEENYLSLIKKFRRNKNISIEEVINELQLNIKNLREIDRKMDLSLVGVSDKNSTLNAILIERFPQLTNQEIAYCNYFLLNLSSKEIGQITGQNPGAVRVFKNKIKNKLGLNKEQNLNAFLKELNIDKTNT